MVKKKPVPAKKVVVKKKPPVVDETPLPQPVAVTKRVNRDERRRR